MFKISSKTLTATISAVAFAISFAAVSTASAEDGCAGDALSHDNIHFITNVNPYGFETPTNIAYTVCDDGSQLSGSAVGGGIATIVIDPEIVLLRFGEKGPSVADELGIADGTAIMVSLEPYEWVDVGRILPAVYYHAHPIGRSRAALLKDYDAQDLEGWVFWFGIPVQGSIDYDGDGEPDYVFTHVF